jgi:anti-sigma factor RsiW
MAEHGNQREQGKWSGMRPHEEFLELCAIATSGDLSAEEQEELRAHLATCAECRQALSEFEAVAGVGVPLLATELSASPPSEPHPVAEELAAASPARAPARPVAAGPGSFARRNGHGRGLRSWNYVWVSFAAAVVLTFALGIYSYRAGQQRALQTVRVAPSTDNSKTEALERRLSDTGHEREALQAQLAVRDRALADLRHQLEQQSAALAEMKSTQASLEQSLQANNAEKQWVAQERATLNQKLDAATTAMQKTQAELDSVRQQRTQDQMRYAGLEGQIKDLNALVRERDQTIDKQGELLAHDRDIRDLMGARDLYIAEVYDVERDGATRKPYGRVFYTKGKSLIFYAYDLDQQAGVRNASTFQAWGRRGPDKQQALNLGIFYEDNIAKKRWVLKFDDPKSLAQIDAVFVTVEPNGGSHKPSGKPLLFAYLKVDPNHP